MFTALGNNTKTTILIIEYGKLSLEFVADAAIKCGQPVKLNATGGVSPWAVADGLPKLLGHAFSETTASGELITIFTRGYMLINALPKVAVTASGLGKFDSWNNAIAAEDGNTGWNLYAAAATADEASAWILDPSTAVTDIIRVLLMG